MNAASAQALSDPHHQPFDSRAYLLGRYGLRMNKRELCFEAKKSRATIDNMRNPRHRSYDKALAAAEVTTEGQAENGVPALFRTAAIADWLGDC